MDNVKICETLTKLDAKGIKKALNEFADFDIEIRNEIFKMQRANFHKLKERHKDCDCKNRSKPDNDARVRPDAKTEFNRTVKRCSTGH